MHRFFFEHVANSVLTKPFNGVEFTTNYACRVRWARARRRDA